MKVLDDGVVVIEAMTRNDFHQKVVRGIGQKRSFGAVASFGAKNVTKKQRAEVIKDLASLGVVTTSDDAVDAIVAAITARAASLR